jgi:undecaprenyl-diphosphatase
MQETDLRWANLSAEHGWIVTTLCWGAMVGLLWWGGRTTRLADAVGGLWIDRTFLDWLLSHRQPVLDRFFSLITWAGSLYLLLPLTAALSAWLFRHRQAREGLLITLSLAGASLITHAAKWLAARPRPLAEVPLVPTPLDWSFPSAHTTQITAFTLSLMVIKTRFWPHYNGASALCALLLVAFVGLSRLYLQVHFLSDVIMGALVAVFWVLGLICLQKWLLIFWANC